MLFINMIFQKKYYYYPSFFIKIPRDIIIFFVGGGEVIREGGYYYQASSHHFKNFIFFQLGTLLKEGCLLVGGYFNEEIRVFILGKSDKK